MKMKHILTSIVALGVALSAFSTAFAAQPESRDDIVIVGTPAAPPGPATPRDAAGQNVVSHGGSPSHGTGGR